MSGVGSAISEVAELELIYEPRPWAFAQDRALEIERHWLKRKTALPRLFDGRVLVMSRHEFVQRSNGETILQGAYFETSYSAFLAWRDFGFPDREVVNCFSMAALQSSDGAFLLGEMASHTANAGSIYFAAGTPDLSDVFGTRVDLAASVRRELEEETGVSTDEGALEPGWTIVCAPPRIACMKILRLNEPALSLKTRIEAYLAADPGAELKRMHIVRSAEDIDEINMPRFVVDFLRYALKRSYNPGEAA
jgi:8-oxo-dGTP pyrophosphatase MutT (NUDIX family)